MIAGLLLDFYGTVVHEDDEIIAAICEEIAKASPATLEAREVARFWWATFSKECADRHGHTFRQQRDIERTSIARTLDEFGVAGARVAELGGFGELVQGCQDVGPQAPEQPKGGADDYIAEVDQRCDIENLHLEDVTWLCACYLHRAGERMHLTQIECEDTSWGQRSGRHADVQGVPAQELHRLTLAHPGDRRNGL